MNQLPAKYPDATVCPQPASASLLDCARRLEADGQIQAALSAFRAASQCTAFPEGKLALAEFLIRHEDFAAATAEYRKLLADTRDPGTVADSERDSLATVVLHNLAAVCRQSGDHGAASTLQQNSLKSQLRETGSASPEDLGGCALDAIHRGEYELAETLLLRSLHEEAAAGSRSGIAADCGNLGVLAGLRGDLAVGIRFLGRACRIHRELADDLAVGTDFLNLAELFRVAGRWTLAERCLNRARRHFEEAGAPASLAKVQLRLAELHQLREVRQRDPLLN